MSKFFLLLTCIVLGGCNRKIFIRKNSVQLQGVFDGYSKENYRLNPLSATANGINDYNDQLGMNLSVDYVRRSLELTDRYLDTLKTVDNGSLPEADEISVAIFKYQLLLNKEALVGKYDFYRPVDQFVFSFPQRFAVLGSGAGAVPFHTEKDFRNFISRMKAFGIWIDYAIANMKEGVKLHNTNPRAAMEKVPVQLQPLFQNEGEKNIFYKPLLALPKDLDSASSGRLKNDYAVAIDTYIRPAYKKLHDYLVSSYIPAARTTTGLLDNKNGKEEYAFWLRYYTTTGITPGEIFDLGLKEVARIRNEMDSLKQLTGFKGDLNNFFAYLKTDPKFFPFKTEEEVLDRYRSFEARMEPQLNRQFNIRPKAKFEVRSTEKFREGAGNAQYIRPSRDGNRPGVFYETVRDPLKFGSTLMETIFLHEAVPGHHYQLSIQQEANIPEFRKTYYNGAFIEGWGLYAESLGTALGMFTDPYQYMGRLSNEMERAVRLVVDAGMHAKGWTREKCIHYVLENQPVTGAIAEQLIERYMVTPGQADSYKVGELKIIALREKAKKILGDRFDIREFHDEVLKDGCLPLSILETRIDKWIKSKKA